MVRQFDENKIIGELLLARGLVSREQIESALYVQNQKPHLRIGEILLSMGLLSIEQLDHILSEHLSHQFIGTLLLSQGFISQEQLSHAVAEQERLGKKFGEVLTDLGYVTKFQLERLLATQRTLRRPKSAPTVFSDNLFKKTKIVATIGPASASEEMIRALIQAGVNIFRFNFSHGKHEDHAAIIALVRQIALEKAVTVGILQDIQGPKIRLGNVLGSPQLQQGDIYRLKPGRGECTAEIGYVSYDRLLEDVEPGAAILIDDGRLELSVEKKEQDCLACRVLTGGMLSSNKGVNFPGSFLKISVLTDKDKEDLIFGIKQEVDFIAASFIQTAADVMEVRNFIKEQGGKNFLIAKIERREAVQALQEIIAAADGVMVARGDLGVEFNPEDVPLIQKQIIRQANIAGKPVITATQMLDSMLNSPRPSRAEASDVANAILDGTDAVMLSNETAVGKYPLEAVRTMSRIIFKVEEMDSRLRVEDTETQRDITESLTAAATDLASEICAAAIIIPSFSGNSARLVARFRPSTLILAVSSSPSVCRQMMLVWGVYPICIEGSDDGTVHSNVIAYAVNSGILSAGNLVVIMDSVRTAAGRSRSLRVESVV